MPEPVRAFRDRYGRGSFPAIGRNIAATTLASLGIVYVLGDGGWSEATGAIRERENASGEHIRIVAMTAHALNGDRERCLAAGMDGYLPKPIEPEMLYAVVEQSLDPEIFVRVHRSAIVNIERVREIHPLFRGDCMLVLTDGSRVKLSRSRREAFERMFAA